MVDEIRERLRTLLERAGLGGSSAELVLAAGVAVALVASWAAWRWWPTAEKGTIVYEQPVVSAATVSTSQPAVVESVTPVLVTVHVAGSVRHPGVYRVADGSRVTDVVDAAGGLLGGAAPERVNLARVVSDGEQVLIPSEDDPEVAMGAAPAAAGPGASAPGPAGGVVNINTADVALLDSLPGVGPTTAQKIVDDRTANGPFARVEDLGRVSGIGPKKLEELAPRATVK